MNRPPILTRVAGVPLVAFALLVLCAVTFLGWWQGQVSWFLGVLAVVMAMRTVRAVRELRGYKKWRAAWVAMGANDAAPVTPKRRGREWPLAVGAALFVAATPFYIGPWMERQQSSQELVASVFILWCAAGLYLVFALLRGILRRIALLLTAGRKAKADDAPVAWLVARPSFSPSRADATRALPDYCARLLTTGRSTEFRRITA